MKYTGSDESLYPLLILLSIALKGAKPLHLHRSKPAVLRLEHLANIEQRDRSYSKGSYVVYLTQHNFY